ncbi:MAG: hypothetical protein QGH93_06335, partial [Gammaproteobacteria bacterium]|nr:hypothetical protein [Gammaproteobacteria bacterium]
AVAETVIAGDPAAAGTAVTDPAAAGETASAEVVSLASKATASRSAVITVTTQDGDTVDLQISIERTAQVSAAMIDGSDGTAASLQSDQARDFQFSLNVAGELDRGETKAIRKLFHKIKSVLHKFAKADYGKAIEKFAKLKLNTEQLANVAMDLSSSRSITVAGLYAAAATPLPSTDATTTDVAAPVPAGTSDVPAAGPAAPVPATPNQSVATAVHLATNRSITFSPNSFSLQQTAEAAYNHTSAVTAQTAPPAADDPGQAVVDLAELLEPFVNLFKDMLNNTHFSKPGDLIAGLTAALVDLQASLVPADTDGDSDPSVPAPADTDPAAPTGGNTTNTDSLVALATLLQDFMGALDNGHDKHHHDHDHHHHHDDHHKISDHGGDDDQPLSVELGEQHDDD